MELVGPDDAMSQILWSRLFIQAQGYTIKDIQVIQDNQSAMKLELNGKSSSGKKNLARRYLLFLHNGPDQERAHHYTLLPN